METEAEYKVSPKPIHINKVLEKINEIAKVSATGDYIYRGEPECYDKVSSSLYREYLDIETEHFNIEVVQADILEKAHDYTPHKMEDFELLATLQHFGDKTNLIDFTTDYLVALFFACDRNPKEPGRVILLQRQPEGDPKPYEVKKPPRTIGRAEAQKSIFVQATKGFVEPDEIVTIPARLKAALLDHLRKHHDISTKTIYNDLQGFIENRGFHKNAYTEFYKGFTSQDRSDSAETVAERQECYNDAITHYNKSIALDPEHAPTYNNRGVVYRETGDFSAAIDDYNKAIELEPENANAYNNRGVVYRETGEFSAAIEDHTKAIELEPENSRIYNNRGLAYRETGEFSAAIDDYNKAIELEPENANAYNNRGVVYRETGEFSAAIDDFNKAIELEPENSRIYSNRGVAYAETGDFSAAIDDFNKAIELEPENSRIYSNRGVAYVGTGDFSAAIDDYNTAINLDPELAEAYCNRGETWLHLSEWDKAKADFITAKEKGIDIVEAFRNDHESIEAFEAKHGVKVPEDIAALLQ